MDKSPLRDPKVCRIFFSSPFNGMEGEREALTKLYWPQIQSLCSSKGIQFVPVDMRWGITLEAADNAQTINICLREIDRSDMFVGFYGQRYGWFGAEDEALQRNFDVALPQFPWIEAFRDRSVTELEFLHGHLNKPGKIPAVICFRDKAYDDKFRAEAEERGDKRGIYKFSSESDLATVRMDDLKSRVEETKAKCLDVNMSYKDPAEGAQLMFAAMWKHLTEVMLKVTRDEELSKRQTDLLQHDAFCNTRAGLYVGGEKYAAHLNQLVSNSDNAVILITGKAGCGKSALLTNWVKQQQQQNVQSDDILIYHFIGCTNDSAGGKNILQRLIGTLQHHLNPQEKDDDQAYNKLKDSEIWDMVQALQKAMRQAVDQPRRVIMIVDGLNHIIKEGKIMKPMYWCPTSFPRGVHMIFSTQTSDKENIDQLTSVFDCQMLDIEALSEAERQQICKETLMVRGKELSPDQLSMVVSADNTSNPLYLKILLEELCMFGRFRELSKKIEALVSSQNSEELFGMYLERLEADYNSADYEGNMIEKVMSALYLSRQGLTEAELTEMFKIPSHLWSPLYFSLDKYLVNRQGFLAFAHDELKAAVESRYLTEPDKRNAAYKEQFTYFSVERVRRRHAEEKIPFHFYTELPWLCLQAEEKRELQRLLVSPTLFIRLWQTDRKYELLSYWQYCKSDQNTILELLFEAIDIQMIHYYCEEIDDLVEAPNAAKEGVDYLEALHQFMGFAHFHSADEKVLLRLKNIFEVNTKFAPDYAETCSANVKYQLACLYAEDKQSQKAVDLHQAGIEYYENRIKQEGQTKALAAKLSCAHHGCGVAYWNMQMTDEAEKAFSKAMEISEQHGNDLANFEPYKTQHMMAQVHADQGKYELAIKELEEVFQIEEKLFFGTLPPAVAHTLSNLGICYRKVKQFDKAEEVYKKALQIKLNALGEVHYDIAKAYVNLGNLALNREQWDLFGEYNSKAIKIFEEIGLGDGQDAHFARDNMAQSLVIRGKMEEAEPVFWEIFEFLTSSGKLSQGLPYVQREFMRYFALTGRLEEAKKVIIAHMASSHVSPLHFKYLAEIDLEASKTESGERVERPYEHSLQKGLELFPGEIDVLLPYVKRHLLPDKDIAAITQAIEKYYSISEDQTDNPVVQIGVAIEEAGFKEETVEFYQKWQTEKFPDSEAIYRNLAVLHSKAGNLPECLRCMTKASELNPEVWLLKEKVAMLALQCENLQLAKDTLAAMEEKWGDQEDVMNAIKPHKEIVAQWEEHIRQQEQQDAEGDSKEQDPEQDPEPGQQDSEH